MAERFAASEGTKRGLITKELSLSCVSDASKAMMVYSCSGLIALTLGRDWRKWDGNVSFLECDSLAGESLTSKTQTTD